MDQNRLDEAKAVAQQATDRKLDSVGTHIFLFDLAFMRKDAAEMERQVGWARGKPGEPFLLVRKAAAEFALGKNKQGQETLRETTNLAEKAGMREFAAFQEATQALRLGVAGDCASSRAAATSSLLHFPDGSNRDYAFVALAMCGDAAKAKQGLDALEKEYPDGTLLQLQFKPVLLSIFNSQLGKLDEAVSVLEPARRTELGYGTGGFTFGVPYFRGLVYLKKKSGELAAAEFKKILDAQYHNPTSYFVPMSQLQLARAYAMENNSAKARTAYQDFLTLWKDADPDIPILKQAKAEYARLL
jgi:tetratricopeptide (TPR) repeat protein